MILRKVLVLALVGGWVIGGVVYADSWPVPTQKEYLSKNGKFSAQVTPAAEKQKPMLELSAVDGTSKKLLWQCELRNKVAPVEVFVADDGQYVVTNDEWHGRGYGEYVVAFYGMNGLIKNYSMEQVLHLPKEITREELWRTVPHTFSSRHWDEDGIKFLDRWRDKSYFCVWLGLFERWIAWNIADGNEVSCDDRLTEQWNSKARLWALEKMNERSNSETPYKFLGHLKDPNDRAIIEVLLGSSGFGVGRIVSQQIGKTPIGESIHRLERLISFNGRRVLAEKLLARWDGRAFVDEDSGEQLYHYLGKVRGVVRLPEIPGAGDVNSQKQEESTLCVYMMPVTGGKANSDSSTWIHRMAVGFDRLTFVNYELTSSFPFSIEGVTPGEYQLKAVWGRNKPFNYYAGRVPSPAQEGDFESLESRVIIVRAAQVVEDMIIDCTRSVAQ